MPHPEQPSYEELAAQNTELTARVAELLAVVAEQAALIESLRAEVAALRRQAGRDSSNSSQPPGQDSPAAKAKAGRREARLGRPQGGQKGHPGASLAWTARPDETRAAGPGTCGGCGERALGAADRGVSGALHPSRVDAQASSIRRQVMTLVPLEREPVPVTGRQAWPAHRSWATNFPLSSQAGEGTARVVLGQH